MKILRADGHILFAAKGYKIFKSSDSGISWHEDGTAKVRPWKVGLARHNILSGIFREGIFSFLHLNDGVRLCIASKTIFRAEACSKIYLPAFTFPKGSRPLNFCRDKNNNIFWGEYFLNLKRSDPVRVFFSDDTGKTWKIIYEFAKGRICHIHRIIYDPYEDKLIILTGDRDNEVFILKADKKFKRIDIILSKSQKYRTTSLIPLKNALIYGTDNPKGQNCIMAIDRTNKKVHKITEIPGPVLYGCKAGRKVVFSTMIEKDHHKATIWAGDENGFRMICKYPVRKWCLLWREIAGYPTLILPEGEFEESNILFSPVGTKKDNHKLIRINI